MVRIVINAVDIEMCHALRALAQRHGRSLEDEARAILIAAVSPPRRIDWSQVASVHSGRTEAVTRDAVNSSYDVP